MRAANGRHSKPLRHAREEGAAAVEFGLVSIILMMVLLGILQYGIYFNDSLQTQQGVREAVRQGVVHSFTACGGSTNDMDALRCNTRAQMSLTSGTAYVKVVKPATYAKGQPLKVCALVSSGGGVSLLPMPNGGWIKAQTSMSIEVDAPTVTGSTGADTLPAAATINWNWCT